MGTAADETPIEQSGGEAEEGPGKNAAKNKKKREKAAAKRREQTAVTPGPHEGEDAAS